MGALDADQAYEMEKRAWQVFRGLGEKHSRIIEGERPTLKFLAVLNELFLTSRIYVESKDFQGVKPPRGNLLGWLGDEPASKNAFLAGYADDEFVYLLPETMMKAVNEAIRLQGDYLSLGKNELLAALAREGLIEAGKEGKPTRVKWIQGGSRRVIYLPRRVLGHDEIQEDEQL